MGALETLLGELKTQAKAANPATKTEAFERAFRIGEKACGGNQGRMEEALRTARAVEGLRLGEASVAAELALPAFESGGIERMAAEAEIGKDATELAFGRARVNQVIAEGNPEKTEKILSSLTNDFRLILMTLAQQLVRLEQGGATGKGDPGLAADTMEVYAPLAEKLGVNTLRCALHDQAFKVLQPEEYARIERKLRETEKAREKELKRLTDLLARELATHGISARLESRVKHIYGIYSKMKRKGVPFEQIYDRNALRVITERVEQCYEALGIVHSLWKPIPEEFDDYIAKPKPNYYQSLHTAVVSENGFTFEAQIRTEEMHRFAEYGVAAHWRYKGTKEARTHDARLEIIREVLQWAAKSGTEGTSEIKLRPFESTITVFTPKGTAIQLPQGAAALDFAYAVHSELGNKAHKIKINGKLVSLEHELLSGDTVEVITSTKQAPKRAWLAIVKTDKARKRIRQALHLEKAGTVEAWTQPKGQSLRLDRMMKNTRLARCCNPLPGDKIVGYQTTKRKVIVHTASCRETHKEKDAGRFRAVDWGKATGGKYLVELRVFSLDRPGILSELLQAATKLNLPIKSVNARKSTQGTALSLLGFELGNIGQLEKLVTALQKVPGVREVSRTNA